MRKVSVQRYLLSKRKPKKRSKFFFNRPGWQHRPSVDLETIFEQADSLINMSRAPEAVALLEPLVGAYPRLAAIHYYLGYAQIKSGDNWAGLSGYEQAFELSRDPDYWLPLASLYLELELNAHALNAFRQVLKTGLTSQTRTNCAK